MSVDRYRGLTKTEVEQSRISGGSNRLSEPRSHTFFQQFVANFSDPIIKVLLAVLLINILFLFRTQNWYETVGIGLAILLATFVSTISEYGSESAFKQLQEESSKSVCLVYRDGHKQEVFVDDLVVGDIVALSVGSIIPADGKLLEGSLSVDQSALNGESVEAEKSTASLPSTNDGLLNATLLFRGSIVCSGKGVMQVTSVGNNTYYGTVAIGLHEITRDSPLKIRLADLAQNLSKLGFAAGACVALSDLFHSIIIQSGFSWPVIGELLSSPQALLGHIIHALLLSLSVVVVAIPEGLPMMITVVLSSNMRSMLRDHVLVRKLVGIETSGSLNLLFTDKTGTLTKGKPTVTMFLDGAGNRYTHREQLARTRLWEMVALSGYYNTESKIQEKTIVGGNFTDKAILSYIHGRQPINTSCSVIKQIPFNSEQKWSGIEICGQFFKPEGFDGPSVTLIKGAPDKILSSCTSFLDKNGFIHPLDKRSPIYYTKKLQEQNAMRLIALAVSPQPLDGFPHSLVFVGILCLFDDLRSDVPRAIETVKKAGIQIIMMTGDSPETAVAIAQKAGLLRKKSEDSVLTSEQISRMSDEELSKRLPHLSIIARALPDDKSRLVDIAQKRGMVVGMTGDGINDAPALKKADVGFAMGSGTEVAKEAGDIVILNNSFSSICKAIQYGRTIFKSIRKFIVFQLTMNLCAVGISIIGPFLGIDMPVTVMQMLWINIIMDTLAGLAFAGEPPLEEYMRELPKKRDEPILNRYMINQILLTGGFTVLLFTLFLKLDIFKEWFRYSQLPLYWMTAFFALFIFSGIFNSFNARTTRLNLLAYLSKNRPFLFIISLIAIIQLGLIYYGGSLFRTSGLTLSELTKVISLSILVIPFDLLRKIVLRLFHKKGTL